jgi:methylmalonic aciduria homocystinuria type C protein
MSYAGSVSEFAWQSLSANVAAAAAEAGFDLVQPFGVAHYNEGAALAEQLEDFGQPNALGLLFANTRLLWPAFTLAYAEDATVAGAAQPLDTYVVARLNAVIANATGLRRQLVFSHVTQPRAFPMQRLAERVGLAALSPSHLAIHPLHGPWLALRAVAVIDVAGPAAAPAPPERPCQGCSAPCLPALAHALSVSGAPLSSAAVVAQAAAWIAVRDACPVGQSYRYGQNQLAYHYGLARAQALPDP